MISCDYETVNYFTSSRTLKSSVQELTFIITRLKSSTSATSKAAVADGQLLRQHVNAEKMGLLTILKKMKQKEKEVRLLMLYPFGNPV